MVRIVRTNVLLILTVMDCERRPAKNQDFEQDIPAGREIRAGASRPPCETEPPQLRSRNENNPYHRGARLYELGLTLPVISLIRRQEARVVGALINRYARDLRRVLEVGPGTGFYTRDLAEKFGEVVAVEDSAQMAQILKARFARTPNVTVLNCDFMSLAAKDKFDLGVAIGVLDYVADPAAFVKKMCTLAQKAVILTAPQRGLWGKCFASAAKLRKISVYCHARHVPSEWAPQWHCTITEVGLKTPLTKGLTLVSVLEPR